MTPWGFADLGRDYISPSARQFLEIVTVCLEHTFHMQTDQSKVFPCSTALQGQYR